ncbi:hypothetical protein ASF61_10695 [Duganella sp. Leaf126]|uniref:GNAT family N-acetyltransferase n=1 Tax=Duganella sp. Leaf126 TaxID=1736266 RepID=UPI0006FC3124|nr:GNAT family protein [Duganella sp. Leaf126]KQQ33535.1 hypothetical protein ASF61_10695 [Duganella sp. Leaf126]
MIIRTLQANDAPALLAFELANRAWFAQHVAVRPASFYSRQGVAAHITDYLDLHRQGTLLPCVLVDAADAVDAMAGGGAIVDRANLRHIDRAAATGEVGYRIAHAAAGRGLGSLALRHLLHAARHDYQLRTVDAWITDENPGSRRLAEKHGFVRLDLAPLPERCGGVQRWAYGYRCILAPTADCAA